MVRAEEARPLALISLAEEHLAEVVAASADWPSLAEFGPPYWRPRSAAELRRKLDAMSGPLPATEYTYLLAETGRLVGECSLHAIDYRNRVGQVGVCIWNPADRGQGRGAEALRLLMAWATGYLGMRRLEGWVVEGNAASLALVSRAGFIAEGTMRKRYLCAGEWRDVHLLAYLVV